MFQSIFGSPIPPLLFSFLCCMFSNVTFFFSCNVFYSIDREVKLKEGRLATRLTEGKMGYVIHFLSSVRGMGNEHSAIQRSKANGR